MGYDLRPLYPQQCDCSNRESCVRMPLFGDDMHCSHRDVCGCSQTVRLENPCRPGECAEVTLSVDSCGNLVVCVHRDHSCGCRSKKHWY